MVWTYLEEEKKGEKKEKKQKNKKNTAYFYDAGKEKITLVLKYWHEYDPVSPMLITGVL